MITTLDCRTLSPIFLSDLRTRNPEEWATLGLSDIYKIVSHTPNLRCLVMDRRAEFSLKRFAQGLELEQRIRDKAMAYSSLTSTPPKTPGPALAVLSLVSCPDGIPRELFGGPLLSGLVYFDLSSTSARTDILWKDVGALSRQCLPNLRVLKLAQMGWTSSTAAHAIFPRFSRTSSRLWSLDLSNNRLDDKFIDILKDRGVYRDRDHRLQRDAYFEVEGKLRSSEIDDVDFVIESDWSGSFSHPLRYLADPPSYSKEQDADGRDGNRDRLESNTRILGNEPIRGDTIQDAIAVMAGGTYDPESPTAEWPGRSPSEGPLTHIHLNGTDITLMSIQGLLDSNCGYIEHFECDQAKVLASLNERNEWRFRAPWLSSEAALYGFPGSAYLFRPVISSNLRVLKIHHSLVTNTLTIRTEPSVFSQDTSVLENIWIAEKFFTASMDLAYPQRYEPDMNSRLYSLTLAKIPQYSTGIIVKRIIEFLKKLALQEQAIDYAKKLFPGHRGPPILRGLRHLCLEFDHGARKEMANLSKDDDIDQAMTEFSSFDSNTDMWDTFSASREPVRESDTQTRVLTDTTPESSSICERPGHKEFKQSRLTVFPFSHTETEYYREPSHNIRIWIGNGRPGPPNTPAVNAYMRNLTHLNQHDVPSVIAATPCHVATGVPAGSYLFRDAWNRIAIPGEDIRRPTKAQLAADLRDVEAEIKAFRLASREVYARLVGEGRLTGEVGQHEYYRGSVRILR